MATEESGSDNNSDETGMKVLNPQFMELFQKLHHDVEKIFPSASPMEQMIATVGALLSMKIEQSVVTLKTPVKVVKMGPGGIIQPG